MTSLTSELVQQGFITLEQLQDAKDKQIGAKKPLVELLIEMGFVTEENVNKVAAKVLNMPVLSPQDPIDFSLIKLIPFEIACRYGIFPVRFDNDELIVATSNPVDVVELDNLRQAVGLKLNVMLASRSRIEKLIEEYYHISNTLYDLLKNLSIGSDIQLVKEKVSGTEVLAVGAGLEENFPAAKLVGVILSDAKAVRATDIHLEPQENSTMIRYRIDGYLKNILRIEKKFYPRLVARIKVLAEMDIAETRRPQDGRVQVMIGQDRIDLRIGIVPTMHGEKIAIRLLDREEIKSSLDNIGFEPEELERFTRGLQKKQGIILVTGPTGSGKTSTLYAALNFVKSETKQIITIEDPIEYQIEGINQIQLNAARDVTFSTSLREILRQDPNIIFVGEIRDGETADIAFRSSQTGHLVFSTLHTNNAVATISRLVDIGLEPYLIASSLVMVVAQRLVRIICPHCKEEYTPDAAVIAKFREVIDRNVIKKFYRGKGCQECGFTGFRGRTAVFEIMEINEAIRDLISNRAQESEILKEARKNGLRPLAESAIRKVNAGISNLDDVSQVIDIRAMVREEQEVQPPPPPPEKRGAKILIVDDEKDLLAILSRHLKTGGYEVVQAANGQEALEAIAKELPDLIIMDVNMPVMDGFQATKAIRSKLDTASIPVMLLTAKTDKESELAGLDAGADDYITKPYDKEKILARVKMLLKRR